MKNKLGCLPRTHNPAIPHLSAMRTMRSIVVPVLPKECHNGASLPANTGVMLNATLGDCTCAGLGHAEQTWTLLARGAMVTPSDDAILDAYEQACGYDPRQGAPGTSNPTDGGGIEQNVLAWATRVGLLQPDGTRHPLLGFVEVDPRNPRDVCEAIVETGGVYIGFNVPRLLPEDPPGALWDGTQNLGPIEGGHCVWIDGYRDPDAPTFDVRSWGERFVMDWPFWSRYVDECYALFSDLWIEANGRSPWGFDLATIEAQMAALRAG